MGAGLGLGVILIGACAGLLLLGVIVAIWLIGIYNRLAAGRVSVQEGEERLADAAHLPR